MLHKHILKLLQFYLIFKFKNDIFKDGLLDGVLIQSQYLFWPQVALLYCLRCCYEQNRFTK